MTIDQLIRRHRQRPHVPGVRPGTCVQVCLAVILDEPVLDRIPHVAWLDPKFIPEVRNPHAWWGVVCDTLARYDAEVWVVASDHRGVSLDPGCFPLDKPMLDPSRLLGILGAGPSPRGAWSHAVVVDPDGHLVHDPHPSDAGVPFLDEAWLIVRRGGLS